VNKIFSKLIFIILIKGQIHLQNITCRLKGMHTNRWILANSRVKALPLSVEGHVNTLIKVIHFIFSFKKDKLKLF
jgi:hypothetical protein